MSQILSNRGKPLSCLLPSPQITLSCRDPSKPLQLSTQTTIEDRFHSTAWPQFNQASREAYLEITDRPRVKNYYRNSFIGFWSSFIPQLNKGTRDSSVVEEHNFLPDYFNRQSFFGYVRPYSALHNDPFPPPPMPPTPIPKDLKKPATSEFSPLHDLRNSSTFPATPPKSTAKPATDSKELEELKAKYSKAQSESYSNLLVIVVVIGIAMLVLNILVSAAFVRIVSFYYPFSDSHLLKKLSAKKVEEKKKLPNISLTLPPVTCLLLISITFPIHPSVNK